MADDVCQGTSDRIAEQRRFRRMLHDSGLCGPNEIESTAVDVRLSSQTMVRGGSAMGMCCEYLVYDGVLHSGGSYETRATSGNTVPSPRYYTSVM